MFKKLTSDTIMLFLCGIAFILISIGAHQQWLGGAFGKQELYFYYIYFAVPIIILSLIRARNDIRRYDDEW